MPHDLIEMKQWPGMPAPWSSVDPGEAWVWGDYVALFRTKPILLAEMMAKMTGQRGMETPPIQYPFAMTVFYQKDRSPHGPSGRPILVAALERMNYTAAAKMRGTPSAKVLSSTPARDAPVVKSLFTAESRSNLGNFVGELTRDCARSHFLNLIKQHLSLVGEPVKIGAMADIHGHPDTGWPAKETKKSSGCLFVIIALCGTIAHLTIWSFLDCI